MVISADLKTKRFQYRPQDTIMPRNTVIPSDKKKLVTELKNEAKAEQVWLASDEDQEEVIS